MRRGQEGVAHVPDWGQLHTCSYCGTVTIANKYLAESKEWLIIAVLTTQRGKQDEVCTLVE